MNRILFLLIFNLLFLWAGAQKYTISGYVTDKETGEKLIGANVFDKKLRIGTTTNTYGFYSLTLEKDSYEIVFSYVGYTPVVKQIFLNQETKLNQTLKPGTELSEVEIVAKSAGRVEEMTKMSTIQIPVTTLKSLPSLLGEVDVLKTIQLLPGVQGGVEGTSGIYVRGGGPDQNLILLDGVPVYNASHLFGFFSVFNADAIKNVELIKGGFPARYGGRLSSVLEINMKEGNSKKYHVEGSIGIIASKITVEGPIKKENSSFIISARRTYADVLAQPFIKSSPGNEDFSAGYYFYDFNAKINHKLSDKDRLFFSVYTGRDKFYVRSKPYSFTEDSVTYTERFNSSVGWGNVTSALRWNHQFTSKLFSNTTLTYSFYEFNINNEQSYSYMMNQQEFKQYFKINYSSGIQDWAGKIDFDFLPNPAHFIKFGVNTIYHTFSPGIFAYKISFTGSSNIDSSIGSGNVYASETFLYFEDDYRINEHLKINPGLHYSGFFVKNNYYQSLQPRINARYLFDKNWSLKFSYANMQQYIHLLTNSNIGLPTDLWIPSTDTIKPQWSNQVAAGFATTIKKKYSLEIETYYKHMSNLVEYKDGATFFSTDANWESKLEQGKGQAYGFEIFFEKRTGNTTGWIGYTLAWSWREFDNINFGKPFPYKYDRRHDISIVLTQKISALWSFSGTWVFGTGNSLTLPIVSYQGFNINDPTSIFLTPIENFTEKNSFRMMPYNRLDLGFTRTKKTKWGESIWNFGVYNAYARKNPFYYYMTYNNQGERQLMRVSLFSLIPSISYNFKF